MCVWTIYACVFVCCVYGKYSIYMVLLVLSALINECEKQLLHICLCTRTYSSHSLSLLLLLFFSASLPLSLIPLHLSPHLISFFFSFALSTFESQNWNSKWWQWNRDRMWRTHTQTKCTHCAGFNDMCVCCSPHHCDSILLGFVFDFVLFCIINLTIRPHSPTHLHFYTTLLCLFSECYREACVCLIGSSISSREDE